jgi:hypothetical protein
LWSERSNICAEEWDKIKEMAKEIHRNNGIWDEKLFMENASLLLKRIKRIKYEELPELQCKFPEGVNYADDHS